MAKGYSLHLGLNAVDPKRYGGWDGKLEACESDAKDMAAIAKASGYAKSTVLLTREATSTNFITEMLKLAKTLKSGDLLLFTYSGHGGQIPDEMGDEDDGMDETWCLFDRQFIDDEIFRLLGAFAPGVRIVALSDSCHSGTVIRMRLDAGGPTPQEILSYSARTAADHAPKNHKSGDTLQERAAPIEVTMDNYQTHKDIYMALQTASAGAEASVPKASVVLISGCMDDQLSLDGSQNGLFTATLKKVWNKGSFKGGYRPFHRTIVSRMPPSQTPNLLTVGPVSGDFLNAKPFAV